MQDSRLPLTRRASYDARRVSPAGRGEDQRIPGVAMSSASLPADDMPAAPGAAAGAKRIEFDDPHAGIGGLQEAEVARVRTLQGGWRWALIVATAVTILLCINQQFSLRFFIGYTQLNTEYFYLLIALMLPFTFLIFPNSGRSPLNRIPWYDIVFFV